METMEGSSMKQRMGQYLKNIHPVTSIVWVALLIVFLFLVPYGIVQYVNQDYPVPKNAEIDYTVFSEHRAMQYLAALSDDYPGRMCGTSVLRNAMEWTADYIRNISSDINVEIQTGSVEKVENSIGSGTYTVANEILNLVVRIEGLDPNSTLLVGAHLDSVYGTSGTMDNGASVAASIELIRNLAAEVQLNGQFFNSIDFVMNGCEEMGLLGSELYSRTSNFTKVRGFINIDATGSGKQILFRNTKKSSNMLKHYAKNAVRPFMNSFGNFLIGITGSGTDFTVYEEFVPGIDLAYTGFNYIYHTPQDDLINYRKGALQHAGDNLLPTIKEILKDREAFEGYDSTVDYFDVLGYFTPGVIDPIFGIVFGLIVLCIIIVVTLIYPLFFVVTSSILSEKFYVSLHEASDKYRSYATLILKAVRNGRDVDFKSKIIRILFAISRMLGAIFLNTIFTYLGVALAILFGFSLALVRGYFFYGNYHPYLLLFSLISLLPMLLLLLLMRLFVPRFTPHCLDSIVASIFWITFYSLVTMITDRLFGMVFAPLLITLDFFLVVCYLIMNIPFVSWGILRLICLIIMVFPITYFYYVFVVVTEMFIPRTGYSLEFNDVVLNNAIAVVILSMPGYFFIRSCSWLFFPADYDLVAYHKRKSRSFQIPKYLLDMKDESERSHLLPKEKAGKQVEMKEKKEEVKEKKEEEKEEVLSTSSVSDVEENMSSEGEEEVKPEAEKPAEKEKPQEKPQEKKPMEEKPNKDQVKMLPAGTGHEISSTDSFVKYVSSGQFHVDMFNVIGYMYFSFQKYYKYIAFEFTEIPYKGWMRYGATTTFIMIILSLLSFVAAILMAGEFPYTGDTPMLALSREAFYPNGTPSIPEVRYRTGVLFPFGRRDTLKDNMRIKETGDYSLLCDDCRCQLPGRFGTDYDVDNQICLRHLEVANYNPIPTVTMIADVNSVVTLEVSCPNCQSARITTTGCVAAMARTGTDVVQSFEVESERESDHYVLLVGGDTSGNIFQMDVSLCKEKKLDIALTASYAEVTPVLTEIRRRLPDWTTGYAKMALNYDLTTTVYGNFSSTT